MASDPAEVGDPRRETGALVSLALMVLIGSSTATAAKFAVRELPVGLVPIVRFGVAGLCLLPLVIRGGAFRRMLREDGRRLLATAALCVPINQTFFLNGTRLAPTSHVGLIYASCPLVVLILASILGQERLIWRRLAGILASVAGVIVIGLGNLWHAGPEAADTFRGDLLLVGAVVSWGAYLTVNKPLVARHGVLAALAGTFLVGSALDLPIAAWTLGDWSRIETASISAWSGLAHLTLIVTVLGLMFQNQALRELDASQVAVVGNLAPLLTVVWGIVFLKETMTPSLALGGALTLAGILWVGRPVSSPRKAGSSIGPISGAPAAASTRG